ncbi:MAG: hypothetical protein A2Y10_08780 [Planctomycetes bacterium GWF2_41_51]|nr:MAG: hypothetical protein A2Y10_08780 [Planctomycetes bacterium GWF2_41_51]HBG28350.1 hypothetical protein [Phycisphaerales bacterium]
MKINSYSFSELIETTLDGEWGEGEARTGYEACYIIRGTDFSKLNRFDYELPIRWIKQSAIDRKKLSYGDLVLETAGGTSTQSTGRSVLIGKSFIGTHKNKPVLCSSFARHLRINKNVVNPTFLFYLMQSLYKAGYMGVFNIQHTGISRFQFTTFKNKTKLSIPSLVIQKKIAAVLSAYDDLIENNNRRIAILEKMAEELYCEWFVRLRFPGHEKTKIVKGVPEGWDVKRIGDIIRFEKGKNPVALFDEISEETDIYLNVDAIENRYYKYAQKLKSISCKEDETLMLMDGARSSVVFNGKKGIVSSTFAVIRTDAQNRPMLHEYFKANLEAMVSNNTGSAIPHANKEFIIRMCIKLPLNNDLIKKFNEQYQTIFSQLRNLQHKKSILTISRDRLLSHLMSGKIDLGKMDIKFPASMMEDAACA